MRPAHVYANPTDEQYHQLVDALHQQWRTATRAVMILLSAGGMTATEIAALLHYDPKRCGAGSPDTTWKAWPGYPTGHAAADPGWAAHTWANASTLCWPHRRRGPQPGSGGHWDARV